LKCPNLHNRSVLKVSRSPIFLKIHLDLPWSWMRIMMMMTMTMKWRRSHNLSILYYLYYPPNLSLQESRERW
jgi:hypothetical protein